jgi:hypothetical protein
MSTLVWRELATNYPDFMLEHEDAVLLQLQVRQGRGLCAVHMIDCSCNRRCSEP